MLPETFVAAFLGTCLSIFYLVNLYNLTKNRRKRTEAAKTKPKHTEPSEPPKTFALALAAFGTLFFWFESIIYVVLVFAGVLHFLDEFLFPLRFSFDSYLQMLGVVLTAFGYFFFTWSVIARGRYATAWNMSENHKLVTWGPYRYVRHPSYLSYFVMFFGLFFIWLSWIALIPIVAILGYLQIVDEEERMLVQRFGDEYLAYQKKVGRFFPKRRIERD